MARIRIVPESEATGSLKDQYDAAVKRAGRVFRIVALNSLRPDLLRSFIGFYVTLMRGPGELSRVQREALAVVTSKANHCHY
ncbi:MAG: carboxymuconolactone decarboxylase family protein [Planctomycetales bacterium]|nr:carboxymuconolactone decarboxylase family protein [Planctomycetales bacterium]